MDSKEINRKINELENMDNPPYEAFGGKVIPYIGWYWRDVDFDKEDGYDFGVTDDGIVGFMENNKWGYDEIMANKEEWRNIKELIIIAINDPHFMNFAKVHNAIQELGEKKR